MSEVVAEALREIARLADCPDAYSVNGKSLSLMTQISYLARQARHGLRGPTASAGGGGGMSAINPIHAAQAAAASAGNHVVSGQSLQPGAVGGPVGGTVGGHATVGVEVYALGAGVTLVGQGHDLPLTQGTFELEAAGRRLVFDPGAARHTQWLVEAVERDVAPVGKPLQAVDQEDAPEFFGLDGHDGSSGSKTVILSPPQGAGKSLVAPALARRLGCRQIIDEWSTWAGVRPGALHLTQDHVEVTA